MNCMVCGKKINDDKPIIVAFRKSSPEFEKFTGEVWHRECLDLPVLEPENIVASTRMVK